MFVEPANWEMTMADWGKAEEGGTFRRKKLCWKLFASSLSQGSATAWTNSDKRADAGESPCQGKQLPCLPLDALLLSSLQTEPKTATQVLTEVGFLVGEFLSQGSRHILWDSSVWKQAEGG